MNTLLRFAEKLGMDLATLILLLIIAFAVLSFLANRFSSNVVGKAASWAEQYAQPHG